MPGCALRKVNRWPAPCYCIMARMRAKDASLRPLCITVGSPAVPATREGIWRSPISGCPGEDCLTEALSVAVGRVLIPQASPGSNSEAGGASRQRLVSARLRRADVRGRSRLSTLLGRSRSPLWRSVLGILTSSHRLTRASPICSIKDLGQGDSQRARRAASGPSATGAANPCKPSPLPPAMPADCVYAVSGASWTARSMPHSGARLCGDGKRVVISPWQPWLSNSVSLGGSRRSLAGGTSAETN